MNSWLIQALKGLVVGLVVSGFNHFILSRAMKKSEGLPDAKAKKIIISRYSVRYLTNILVLFLVYYFFPEDSFMLIGVAIGLTMEKNLYLYKKTLGQSKGTKGVKD